MAAIFFSVPSQFYIFWSPGDMWHMSCLSSGQVRTALTVWDLWSLEDWEEKNDWSTDLLMNYKSVCRTAPATPGLFKIFLLHVHFLF